MEHRIVVRNIRTLAWSTKELSAEHQDVFMEYQIDLNDYDFLKLLPRTKVIEAFKKLLYYYDNEITFQNKKLPKKGDDDYLNPILRM